MLIKHIVAAGILISIGPLSMANSTSPYAGMQVREIKSLSEDDLSQLRRGAGWRLALPAELNGMPGPAHVLELKDELSLTAEQTESAQALFDQMKNDAIPVGERLIEAEKQIESVFASGEVDENTLRSLLKAAEQARSELRFIHLSQHYKTSDILTNKQVSRYNQLRGYVEDSCANIPAGHDPEMYRKHMGCR